MEVARVHVRSWQVGYRNLMPDDYLDRLRPEDRVSRYDFDNLDPEKPHTIVAIEDGKIRGFATTAPTREPNLSGYGELLALYVDRDYWRLGIGIALIAAARARLSELGFRHAMLWVLAGNRRAERFYLKDGWTPDGEARTDQVWGLRVNEVRYQRKIESAL